MGSHEECTADSQVFQLGLTAWLRANGIFPTITYDEMPAEYANSLPDDMRVTPLIVCNHTSYLDGPILASSFGAPKIIAKKGTTDTPIVGNLAKEIGVIEVDRDD